MAGRQPPSVDPVLYPDWRVWAKELLRHLQLEAEQSASSRVYALPEHASTDLPSAATPGLLLWKPDTLYASISFNNTWNDLAVLSSANTFTASQVFQSSDEGASFGPSLTLDRNSASPAASDALGAILCNGRDSNAATVTYASLWPAILDPTAGSTDSVWTFNVNVAGAFTVAAQLGAGLIVGNPTGYTKGTGSINIADKFYVQGNQILQGRATGWGAPTGTPTRTTFDTTTVTLPQLAERVKALIDDLTTHGVIGS